MAKHDEPLFIGWAAKAPRADRRFFLGAGLAAVAGAVGLGFTLGRAGPQPGPGAWDQGAVGDFVGALALEPYPALRTFAFGAPRTALLAGNGKLGVRERIPDAVRGLVRVRATPIVRGEQVMLAAVDGEDWIAKALAGSAPPRPSARDLGPTIRAGEILDAKCWLGAMNPGEGLTHKACAAVCARGRLPLAFCDIGLCGSTAPAPLFVDADGAPHEPDAILALLAEQVMAQGRLVMIGDHAQFRVAPQDIRRI